MSDRLDQSMEQLRQDTAVMDRIGDRVRLSLDSILAPEDLRILLHTLPQPDAQAEDRVRDGVLARLSQRRPSARRRMVPAMLVLGSGLAAAAVSMKLAEPTPLSAALQPGHSAQVPGVELSSDGVGQLSGTDAAPVIRWQTGRLKMSVDPAAELDLTLRTREARARLLSGQVELRRDKLGTHIVAKNAQLDLRCLADGQRRRITDAALSCLPVSAAGMLGRARALQAEDEPTSTVLAAVEGGLERADATGVTGAELSLLRASLLAEDGRQDEALAELRRRLSDGDAQQPRWQEMNRLAAAIALSSGPTPVSACRRARPHLRALAPNWPDAARRLVRCQALLDDASSESPPSTGATP